MCELSGYVEFDNRVPLRRTNGQYHEAKPELGVFGVLWLQGARPISQQVFDRIVASGARRPR
jgi:hypothetical protein